MTEYRVRRILVPVDFSTSSGDALRFAQSLASALGASIDVLHVIDPSGTMLDRVADRPSGGDPDTARALLRDLVAALGSGSVPMTERIEQGEPQERIVTLARDEGFDLIVMGTRSAVPDGRRRSSAAWPTASFGRRRGRCSPCVKLPKPLRDTRPRHGGSHNPVG